MIQQGQPVDIPFGGQETPASQDDSCAESADGAPAAVGVDPSGVVESMQHWVENTVIGLNLCPFAATAVRRRHLQYELSRHSETGAVLDAVARSAAQIVGNGDRQRTLLYVLVGGFDDFDHFLDMTCCLEQRFTRSGYDGRLQIASFHPQYRFAGAPAEDIANYTNRSPYPAWHLLQEEAVSLAVDRHADPASIPERNVEYLRSLPAAEVHLLLARARA